VATADQYAAWIVANKAKKGTPDFETVAAAYREAVAEESRASTPERSIPAEIGRQVGLTARAGIQAAGATVGLVTDPIGALINQFVPNDEDKAKTARSLAVKLADTLGLPSPENALERVVGAGTEAMAGGGGTVAASRGIAGATTGAVQRGAQAMAAQPAQQLAGAAGAGVGAETAREAGAGEGVQALAALGGGVLGAGAAGLAQRATTPRQAVPAIVREAETAGVPLMTSDAVPPKTFVGRFLQATGERIPLAGTGGMRQTQQQARQDAVRTLAQDYGVDVGTRYDDKVVADLLRRRGELLTRYTGMKQSAMQASGAQPVDVSRALAAIDTEIANVSALGPAAENTGVLRVLQDFKASVQNQPINQLDEVRKLLGERLKDPTLGAPRSLADKIPGRIYGALREDMTDHVAQYGGARAERQWKVANASLSGLMRETDNKRLSLALNSGNETPETVRALLFSSRPSDVQTLFRNLTPDGRRHAQMAVIQEALQKSAKDGLDNVSPKVFSNELGRLSDQVGVFFSPPERQRIEGLRRVLIATQRASEAAAAPPTGVQALPFVGGALLTDLMGGAGAATVTALSIGGLARAVESKPMRGVLMRLAQTKAGSAEEAALVKRALAAYQATQADSE
jgi:hypothetical protein